MEVFAKLESFVSQLRGGPGATLDNCPTCKTRLSACLICRDCGHDANWDKWGRFLKTLKHLPKKEHRKALRRLRPEERAHVDALIRDAYMEWAREAREEQLRQTEVLDEDTDSESTLETSDDGTEMEVEAEAAEEATAEETSSEVQEEVPSSMPWGEDPDDFERDEPRKRFEMFAQPAVEDSPWITEDTEVEKDPTTVGFAPERRPEDEFNLNPWAPEEPTPPAGAGSSNLESAGSMSGTEDEFEGPRSVKRCPFCDSEVQPEAPLCQHCGQDLIDE
jgi:hypothetical protein